MKDKEIKNYEMTKEKPHWLDDKRNVKRIIYALYFVCAALFLSDFFIINTWFLVLIPGLGSTLFTDL